MARARNHPRRGLRAPASLRIVGGCWRSRRLPIAELEGLRPTADRVRETLFNWLAPYIEGARCLDAFAGTGALGLEALSRGAAQVRFIERDAGAAAELERALHTLGAGERARVECADALTVDLAATRPDVVFVDPPFAADLHAGVLAKLRRTLAPGALVYVEYPAARAGAIQTALGAELALLRGQRAGQVGYCLARARPASEDGRR